MNHLQKFLVRFSTRFKSGDDIAVKTKKIREWCEKNIPKGVKWDLEKKNGQIHCPHHDDQNPSCSISVEKQVFHCFKPGCGSGTLKKLAEKLGVKYPFDTQHRDSFADVYKYFDEKGNLSFEIVKTQASDDDKAFFVRRPDGEGGYVNKLNGQPTVPYRLPQVLNAISNGKPIFIVEGEKDADNLGKLGFDATTNPFGASKWNKSHDDYFISGSKVFLIPDADVPGRKHMDDVARSLSARGCDVKIIDLGYTVAEKRGKDVSDWLAAGHSKKELQKLIENAKVWTPEKPYSSLSRPFTSAMLLSKNLPEQQWVIPDLIPEGFTIIAGPPKIGKSWLVLNVAISVSSGCRAFGDIQVDL